MDKVKELFIDKEFENRILEGQMTAEEIKEFMIEKKVSSLIMSDGITTIHQNPVVKSDFYCYGEGSIIDGKGSEYWELGLEDFVHIKKYNKAIAGIKELLKERFLVEDFRPEKHELLKEKFEIVEYNEKFEILKYTFYVQQGSKLIIYQYTYDSALKDSGQSIKQDVVKTDIKELCSLI